MFKTLDAGKGFPMSEIRDGRGTGMLDMCLRLHLGHSVLSGSPGQLLHSETQYETRHSPPPSTCLLFTMIVTISIIAICFIT